MDSPSRLVLVVMADSSAPQVALAFDSAGLGVELVTPRELATAVREKSPALVWLMGELGQPHVSAALEIVGEIPVLLLSTQPLEAAYFRQCRHSVVEVLPAPFSPKSHPTRVTQLLEELDGRSGSIRVRGTNKELKALLDHLAKARRSGSLTVTGASDKEGSGEFRHGRLQDFSWGPMGGPQALSALSTSRNQMQMVFEESLDSNADDGLGNASLDELSTAPSTGFGGAPSFGGGGPDFGGGFEPAGSDEPLELDRPEPRASPRLQPASASAPRTQPSGPRPPASGSHSPRAAAPTSGPKPAAAPPSASGPRVPAPASAPRGSSPRPMASPTLASTIEDLEALTGPLPSPQRRPSAPPPPPAAALELGLDGPSPPTTKVAKVEIPVEALGNTSVDPQAAEDALLLVDDDDTLLTMMATFFAKKGYPVATAVDGVQALERLGAQRYSLVISDLAMPRLDGWGLVRTMREDARLQEVPVALFSAHDDFRERLRAHHSGAQGYFQKSLKLHALEPQVKELLEPRRRFRRLLALGQSVGFDFSALGPQWVLRTLAKAHFTGTLDATEQFAQFHLALGEGQLDTAKVKLGSHTLTGERALQRFLATRSATGTLAFNPMCELAHHFEGGTTEQLLGAAVAQLNADRCTVRDQALKDARGLEVDGELFALYVTQGPAMWQPIVRALCEEKLAPREVMQRMQVTPQEMTQVVQDLLRRGVVALKA